MFVLLFFQLHITITYIYAIYQSMHGSFTSDVMQVCIKYVSFFGLTFFLPRMLCMPVWPATLTLRSVHFYHDCSIHVTNLHSKYE